MNRWSKRWGALLLLGALSLWACDDDDASPEDAQVEDAAPIEEDACIKPERVSYCDELPGAPSAVDPKSFFPLVPGAAWRYREQTAEIENPPPVEFGNEVVVGDSYRETHSILEIAIEGEPHLVDQRIRETYVVEPAHGLVGPVISLAELEITETDIVSSEMLRHLVRAYEPAYSLFSDTWHVGEFDTNIVHNDITLTETITVLGEEEPREASGVVPQIRVLTTNSPPLAMEGKYREGIYKVEIYDDFTAQVSRTFWLQKGVGPVQWRFRDAQNVTFTLTETNLE